MAFRGVVKGCVLSNLGSLRIKILITLFRAHEFFLYLDKQMDVLMVNISQ